MFRGTIDTAGDHIDTYHFLAESQYIDIISHPYQTPESSGQTEQMPRLILSYIARIWQMTIVALGTLKV